MKTTGPSVMLPLNMRLYSKAQLRKAQLIALLLNRGVLILCETPEEIHGSW